MARMPSGAAAPRDGAAARRRRVVLDESHRVARLRSALANACAALRAARRWCLTGTPWQREMRDALGQLQFLHIAPHVLPMDHFVVQARAQRLDRVAAAHARVLQRDESGARLARVRAQSRPQQLPVDRLAVGRRGPRLHGLVVAFFAVAALPVTLTALALALALQPRARGVVLPVFTAAQKVAVIFFRAA